MLGAMCTCGDVQHFIVENQPNMFISLGQYKDGSQHLTDRITGYFRIAGR